jgi:hypothetical protein
VGAELPPGRYVITSVGTGNLNVTTNNGRPVINTELSNTGGPHSSGVPSVTLDLGHGYNVRLSNFQNVTFTPAGVAHLTNVLTTGYWTVGVHIAAGEYTARPTTHGDRGNLNILNAAGTTVFTELLETSLRVNLQNGQIVRITALSSVTFERN